jgi:hypothetical protein
MPMDLSTYPPDWQEVSRHVREVRASGRCECRGECGKSHGPRFRVNRCHARKGNLSENGRGTVVLTCAHLWRGPCKCAVKNGGMKCGILSHLRAMCQGCHLRYDIPLHARNARRTRTRKATPRGQLGLPFHD